MAKKLILGKENNQYVLCYEANGNISKVTQQMIPANTVLEAFMEINESIDQSNKSIKHTEKVVQEAKVKSTKYCSNVALGTNEYGIFTAEIKNSDGEISLGDITANIDGFTPEQVDRIDKMFHGLTEIFNVYCKHVSKTMQKEVESGLKQQPSTETAENSEESVAA